MPESSSTCPSHHSNGMTALRNLRQQIEAGLGSGCGVGVAQLADAGNESGSLQERRAECGSEQPVGYVHGAHATAASARAAVSGCAARQTCSGDRLLLPHAPVPVQA